MKDELIEKLAAKLGTTVEHLWGVLLRQAPISGTVDLIITIAFVVASVFAVRLVVRNTIAPEATEANKYPRAAWRDMEFPAWCGVGILVTITVGVVCNNVPWIVAAFFNPEYWALRQIIN